MTTRPIHARQSKKLMVAVVVPEAVPLLLMANRYTDKETLLHVAEVKSAAVLT